MIWGEKVAEGNTLGKMEAVMMEIGWIIKLQEEEFTFGQMEEDTKEIGITIRCMVQVVINGKMAENMKDNTGKIRNTELDAILGLMVVDTMANGQIVKDMEEAE